MVHTVEQQLLLLLLVHAPPFLASGGVAAEQTSGPCYRRRNVNLAKCTHAGANGQFNLYTLKRSGQKDSWVEHVHTNCCCGSNKYGADNILPEPFSPLLPLDSCQQACSADTNCTAVVWRPALTPKPGPPSPRPPPPQPPVHPGAFDWIATIESSQGGKFFLEARTYLIDRQYQLPAGTELRGAGSQAGGTVIQAVGPPFNKNCGANARNRKGLLLGDSTYLSGFHFIGSETARYDCLTAPVETPGCANTQSHFTSPPTEAACGGDVGGTGGNGVRNATVEDVTVEAWTTQNMFFMAPTKAGARVSQDITVRQMECNGTWADGVNIHGAHRDVLVEESTMRYSGDDSFAMWSVGALQDNITFRNNRAMYPHQGGGPRCQMPCACNKTTCDCPGEKGCRPSGCFANYGGQSSTFERNEGVECYQDAVVIFGNINDGLFGGAWTNSSSTVVRGNKGMDASCGFLWPIDPRTRNSMGRSGFPGSVVCER
eukprot:COSAG02_NODE_5477_length_4292_cov_13.353685_4_plen_486_part_00